MLAWKTTWRSRSPSSPASSASSFSSIACGDLVGLLDRHRLHATRASARGPTGSRRGRAGARSARRSGRTGGRPRRPAARDRSVGIPAIVARMAAATYCRAMKLPLYQVDAFASRVFGGNPAAVVPARALARRTTCCRRSRRRTTSRRRPSSWAANGEYDIRWMTPTSEIDLCGHATLASAWVVFNRARVRPHRGRLPLEERRPARGARDGERLALDFPSRPAEPAGAGALEAVTAALGRAPAEPAGLARLPRRLRERGRGARARARHGTSGGARPHGGDRDRAGTRLRLRLALLRSRRRASPRTR